jgi:Dyp-type peroxidase family
MPVNLLKPLNDTVISNTEKAFIRNLQGNILTGHGREHVILVFVSIDPPRNSEARDYLRRYPVTSAEDQLEDRHKFKLLGEPGRVVRLVALSHSGLAAFGRGPEFAAFPAFSAGMKNRPGVLDNGTTASWQHELRNRIDAVFLLAYHERDTLARVASLLVDGAESNGLQVVFVQEGGTFKNGDGEGVEHFGYVDGRSQPLMLRSAIDEEKNKGGIDAYDPSAPLGQFMLVDPLDPSKGFGSFFVFRKLEQNVFRFKEREEDLADALGLQGADRERAGAMAVGRFEDGTPVTLHNEAAGVPVVNNFDFGADASGGRCPFQSHIRKSNPRGSSPGGLDFDKSRQMARRGITFGARVQDPSTGDFVDFPNDGVGLLFMSYQASIEDQFEFIQESWVNSQSFPREAVPGKSPGTDPVIGESNTADQIWFPDHGSTANPVTFGFHDFVMLKGGEYFYTPSLSGLQTL